MVRSCEKPGRPLKQSSSRYPLSHRRTLPTQNPSIFQNCGDEIIFIRRRSLTDHPVDTITTALCICIVERKNETTPNYCQSATHYVLSFWLDEGGTSIVWVETASHLPSLRIYSIPRPASPRPTLPFPCLLTSHTSNPTSPPPLPLMTIATAVTCEYRFNASVSTWISFLAPDFSCRIAPQLTTGLGVRTTKNPTRDSSTHTI